MTARCKSGALALALLQLVVLCTIPHGAWIAFGAAAVVFLVLGGVGLTGRSV